MQQLSIAAVVFLTVFSATHSAPAQAAAKSPGDWSAVEQALGRKGAMQPGDVIKFAFPAGDLAVTVAGVTPSSRPSRSAPGSRSSAPARWPFAMGDLVLAETEVGPVLQKLQDGGVEQTALHNHVLGESPRIMYMHIAAHGDAAKIARAFARALALSKTPGAPCASRAPWRRRARHRGHRPGARRRPAR